MPIEIHLPSYILIGKLALDLSTYQFHTMTRIERANNEEVIQQK